MTARDLAVRAFWSDHPLCRLYQMAHGYWHNGTWWPCNGFSLRELIAFAESLPGHVIESLGDKQ